MKRIVKLFSKVYTSKNENYMRMRIISVTIILALIQFVYVSNIHSQELQSVSATWEMTNPDAGGTGLSVSTSGYINADEESFSNTSINQYTGPEESQRVRISSNEWPANQTTPIEGVYIEYRISPQTSANLNINNIKLGIGAASISTMKAEIRYSTDASFSTYDVLSYTTGLDNNYLRRDSLTRIDANIDITASDGQTFYLRIYPWVDNDPTVRTGKYVCLKDLIISGNAESIPADASALWTFEVDEFYTTAGGLQATVPVYSDSLAYYDTASMIQKGTNDTVICGTFQSVSQEWFAQIDTTSYYYIQFGVYTKYGAKFDADSISMYIGGWGSPNFEASVYYSTDSDFNSGSVLVDGNVLIEDSVALWQASLDTTIEYGDTLFFRIYPYNSATEAWKKLIALHKVGIYGKTSGFTADPPTVITGELSYISTTFATCDGNIPTDGGAPVLSRGMVWNTSGSPAVNDEKTDEGSGSGKFSSQITGLTPGTDYYVRAYATNGAGTAYGDELVLHTLATIIPPTVTTSTASNILVYSAESGGNVTDWGGDTVTSRGVCWNLTGAPTIDDSISVDGSGLGTFSSYMAPLIENTTFYVRAYAINSAGTGYGDEISLTTQTPSPDVLKVVAKDGSGDYTTVQAAFDEVPDNYTGTYTILVKAGTYYEKLFLDRNKINVVLKGVHADSTILTFDDNAKSDNGSGGTVGTSGSYSVGIEPNDFVAMDITFQNTNPNEQAVALRTNGDRQAFYRCKILGYQDTFYAWGGRGTGRNYFKNCLIEGSVDFIFGRNIVVFDSCEIREIRNSGELTAASTNTESKFGLVFLDSKITIQSPGYDGNAVTSFSLGRPWQGSPRTVYVRCEEPAQLKSEGWDNWNVVPALYAEYMCYGLGSDTSGRNPISRQLTSTEVLNYTVANIFARESNPDYSFDWMPDQSIYKFNQDIVFDPISDKYLNEGTFELEGTATSGLPLSYTSSNNLVATIEGSTVTLIVTGTAEITASQEGNYMYNAADNVSNTLTVKEVSDVNVQSENKLHIYPNPATDRIEINLNIHQPEVMKITDINGQVIKEVLIAPGQQVVNISDLKSGVYIICMASGQYKLIVK